MLTAFLTGLSWPLMLIGVILAILSIIMIVTYGDSRGNSSIGTESWVVASLGFKRALIGLVASLGLFAVGFAIPSRDPATAPKVETVYKVPKAKELYDDCFRVLSNSAENMAACTIQADRMMKMIEQHPDQRDVKVIYKIPKLPDMIQECRSRVKGDLTLPQASEWTRTCTDTSVQAYNAMANKYKEGAR